jgi:hypothetical protein
MAHGDGRVTRFEPPDTVGQFGGFDDEDGEGVDLAALASEDDSGRRFKRRPEGGL